jgi:thiol-disulfide isomerase/thioredoxin
MGLLTRIVRFAAVVMILAPVAAFAGEWRDYEQAAFAEAQQAGETIFVAVHAVWCSTCRAQRPILDALVDDPTFDDAVTFVVDFDTQRDFLRDHKVRYQSTLIVFNGEDETGRSLGDRNQDRIRALFETGP